jgi:hypothetical protein
LLSSEIHRCGNFDFSSSCHLTEHIVILWNSLMQDFRC